MPRASSTKIERPAARMVGPGIVGGGDGATGGDAGSLTDHTGHERSPNPARSVGVSEKARKNLFFSKLSRRTPNDGSTKCPKGGLMERSERELGCLV